MGKRKTMMMTTEAQANRYFRFAMDDFGIQIELFVDPVNEAPLLHYASYDDRDSFISHLKMMGLIIFDRPVLCSTHCLLTSVTGFIVCRVTNIIIQYRLMDISIYS